MAAVTSLEVFISFSRQDIEPAEKICRALEANGVPCWMAHRDIIPGSGYIGSVLEAADHCRVVVVIFSSRTSTASIYVLERTAARSVPIIFVMLDRVEPSAEFKRFKQSSLAIDASAHALESNLRSLVGMVKALRDPNRAGDEMVHAFVDRTLQPGAEHTRWNKLVLSEGQDVAPTGHDHPGGIDGNAIEAPPRAAEPVRSEMRTATHDIAFRLDRVSVRGSSPSRGRPDPTCFSARSISAGLGQEDSKVGLGLALAGLTVIAFVTGMFFHAEINGLLDTIEEFARHLSSSWPAEP